MKELDINQNSEVRVRDFLIMINKDIADGKDEDIWRMTVDDYLESKYYSTTSRKPPKENRPTGVIIGNTLKSVLMRITK